MLYDRLVNFTQKNSWNYRLRQRRLRMFVSLTAPLPKPVSVLDIGGSAYYWEHLFFDLPGVRPEDYEFTITNISRDQLRTDLEVCGRFRFEVADARAMPQFGDSAFDVVHSNSVIEHVGSIEDQIRMAMEVRRIGKRYFVQTPNFWFPFEPHFKAPVFHWLPRRWRLSLVQWRKFGHMAKAGNLDEAARIVDSAQILDAWEFGMCFPTGIIHRERVFGLTKSLVAVGLGD